MSISPASSFIPSLTLTKREYFPFPVRRSAQQRIYRHTAFFTYLNGVMGLFYYGLTLDWKHILKQTSRAVIHKGFIGFCFFYTHEILRGWFEYEKAKHTDTRDTEFRTWKTYLFTAAFLFPAFGVLNLAYRMKPKKLFFRTLVDVLALAAFGMAIENKIRQKREKLLEGQEKQTKEEEEKTSS